MAQAQSGHSVRLQVESIGAALAFLWHSLFQRCLFTSYSLLLIAEQDYHPPVGVGHPEPVGTGHPVPVGEMVTVWL
jgi:hypothetical protein